MKPRPSFFEPQPVGRTRPGFFEPQHPGQKKPSAQRKPPPRPTTKPPLTPKEIQEFVQWVYPRVDSEFNIKKFKKDSSFRDKKFKLYTKDENAILSVADSKRISEKLETHFKVSNGMRKVSLDEAIKILGKPGDTKTKFYKRVGINPLQSDPKVTYGPSTSEGHYSQGKHTITINTLKCDTLPKRMGTLEFEILNAQNKEKLGRLEKTNGTAETKAMQAIVWEFQVSQQELLKSRKVHKVESIEQLAKKIVPANIFKKYTKQLPVYNEHTVETERVKMPTTDELSDTDQRNVLQAYLTKNWLRFQKIDEFRFSPHDKKGNITWDQEVEKWQKHAKPISAERLAEISHKNQKLARKDNSIKTSSVYQTKT